MDASAFLPMLDHRLCVPRLLLTTVAIATPLCAQVGAPGRGNSRHWDQPNAVLIPGATELRKETFTLSAPATLFVRADGHVLPTSWPTAVTARVWISVDGSPASNASEVSWNRSIAPQPHTVNCVAGMTLNAGTHEVALEASSTDGTFRLDGASMSVFVAPASQVQMRQTVTDTPEIFAVLPGPRSSSRCAWGRLPYHSVLSLDMPTSDLPVFVFGSCHAFISRAAGDMMLGLFMPRSDERVERSVDFEGTFSVQDLYPAAELNAAVFVQGVMRGTAPSSEFRPRVQLGGTEFPPSFHSTRALAYRVGGGAALVAVSGGLQVAGWADKTAGVKCSAVCIGGQGSGCPPLGTEFVVSRGTISIPPGHDGRVFISGKARCQGNTGDESTRVTMQIRLNGSYVGSTSMQGTGGWLGGWDSSLSQRTLSSSYLTTGGTALPQGNHTVELVCIVNSIVLPPRTLRYSIWDDATQLVWFD
ncbi:MAG: hypothetical protein AAF628_21645 [Planctomycetota bacterium]